MERTLKSNVKDEAVNMIGQIVTNAIKPCLAKLIISTEINNMITAILDSGEVLYLNVTPTTIHLEEIKNMRKSVFTKQVQRIYLQEL